MAIIVFLFTLLWSNSLNEARNFTANLLKKVNEFRENHDAGSLILDSDLTAKAQHFADTIDNDSDTTKSTYPGEITFMLCTNYKRKLRAKEVVNAWYNQVCNKEMDFDFKNTTVNKTRSFTQLVWKASKLIGVGKKRRSMKDLDEKEATCTYVVAIFYPPGNIEDPTQNNFKARYFNYYKNVVQSNTTAKYCEKVFQEGKIRRKRAVSGKLYLHGKGKQTKIRDAIHRSLFYKVPAKFYIDSNTGQMKGISPVGNGPWLLFNKHNLNRHISNMPIRPFYKHISNTPIHRVMSYPKFQGFSYAQTPAVTSSFHSQPLPINKMKPDFAKKMLLFKNPVKKNIDTDPDAWQQVALNFHNKLRVEVHQTPAVRWSTKLAAEAEKQAQFNALQGNLEHVSYLGHIGENLAYNCLKKGIAPVEESILDWYSEICKSSVNFPIKNANSKEVLHFSKVLWASTKFIGCGRAFANKYLRNDSIVQCTYYCCRYSSDGNFESGFETNVKKGKFDKEKTCSNLPKIIEEAKEPARRVVFVDEDTKQQTRKNALLLHNYYRRIHLAPPLKIDDNLNEKAENWALEMAKEGKLKFSNISGGSYGENLWFKCYPARPNLTDALFVKDWYNEVCSVPYDFKEQKKQKETAQFTQIIWSHSNKLGIGFVATKFNGQHCTYVVARYGPKGNIENKFQDNVKEGFFDDKVCNILNKPKSNSLSKESISEKKLAENDNEIGDSGVVYIPVVQSKAASIIKDKALFIAVDKFAKDNNLCDLSDPAGKLFNSSNPKYPCKPVTPTKVKIKCEKQLSQLKKQDLDEENYQDDFVVVMNKFRKMHLSQPVTPSAVLGAQSKLLATQYIKNVHKRANNPGEMVQITCNVFDKVLPPEDAFSNWYNELCTKNYQFETESQTNLHVTQLLWNETVEAGIAYATKRKNSSLCTYVVAKFFPPGNQPGKFVQNVKKGMFDRSFCGSTNTIAISALDSLDSNNANNYVDNVKESWEENCVSTDKELPLEESKLPLEDSNPDPDQLKFPLDPKFPQETKIPSNLKVPEEPKSPLDPKFPQETKIPSSLKVPEEPKHPLDPKFPQETKMPSNLKVPEEPKSPLDPKFPQEKKIPSSLKVPEEPKHPIDPKFPQETKIPSSVKVPEEPKSPLDPKFPQETKVPSNLKIPEEPKHPLDLNSPQEIKIPSNLKVPEDSRYPLDPNFPQEIKIPSNLKVPEEPKSPLESKFPQLLEVPKESKFPQESKADIGESESIFREEPKVPLEVKYPEESKIPLEFPEESKFPLESKFPIDTQIPDDSKYPEEIKSPLELKFPEDPSKSKSPLELPLDNSTNESSNKQPDLQPSEFSIDEQEPFKTITTKTPYVVDEPMQVNNLPLENPSQIGDEMYPNLSDPQNPLTNGNDINSQSNESNKNPGNFSIDIEEQIKTPEILEDPQLLGSNMPFQNPSPVSDRFSPWYDPINLQNSSVTGDELTNPQIPGTDTSNDSFNNELLTTESPNNPGDECQNKILEDSQKIKSPPKTDLHILKVKNELNDFNEAGLRIHNALRSLHWVPFLQLDEELSRKAFEIANLIAEEISELNEKKDLISLDFKFNIIKKCFSSLKILSAEEAVFSWWSDAFCHDKALETMVMSSGTQVVWKTTTKLGMGHAQVIANGEHCSVVVALYTPKGNKAGEFQANVLTGNFDADVMCEDNNKTLQVAYGLLDNTIENVNVDAPENESLSAPQDETKPSIPEPEIQPTLSGPTVLPTAQEIQATTLTPEIFSEDYRFARNAIETHNILRKIHGVPDLKLDNDMSKAAASYAYKIASKKSLEHASPEERQNDGENLAYQCSSEPSDYQAVLPIKDWYNEVCQYKYSFEGSNDLSVTSHFTQMIWKNSVKFGFGVATTKFGEMTCHYYVARYRPAGNIIGEYLSNVLKGTFSFSYTCNNLNQILGDMTLKRSFPNQLKRTVIRPKHAARRQEISYKRQVNNGC